MSNDPGQDPDAASAATAGGDGNALFPQASDSAATANPPHSVSRLWGGPKPLGDGVDVPDDATIDKLNASATTTLGALMPSVLLVGAGIAKCLSMGVPGAPAVIVIAAWVPSFLATFLGFYYSPQGAWTLPTGTKDDVKDAFLRKQAGIVLHKAGPLRKTAVGFFVVSVLGLAWLAALAFA